MTSHCSLFQILSRLQWRMLALWIKIPAKTVLAKTNAMLDLPHVRKVPRTRLFQREELQQRAGSVDSNPGEVVVALCVTSQRADSPHFPKTWRLDISYLWFYLQVRFFFSQIINVNINKDKLNAFKIPVCLHVLLILPQNIFDKTKQARVHQDNDPVCCFTEGQRDAIDNHKETSCYPE